ncbi:hypothetical protein GCM10010329_18850 [Streptomyces spiroverticillatus]|uniref:O-antigen ligase-related domain-containing protein n=1 Tax=Streptomyces finlayi TaxID=67296 RepID=A0A918WTZ2_9ACTN|nr:O-antigen ligase family protein [Streptomyces finlayi]GGZ97753.1 hypothetical protein GCM10010329_18850 [Streptomyces spiroverticillatus]GHC82796.1 hypothetical protein GCM10010334_11330 [Streptomyces finlayi]
MKRLSPAMRPSPEPPARAHDGSRESPDSPAATVAAQLRTACLWVVLLSPAFFATVVWGRAIVAANDVLGAAYGTPRAEVALAPWRMQAAVGWAGLSFALFTATLVIALVAPRPARRRPGSAVLAGALLMYAGPVLAGVWAGHGGAGDWRLWLAPLLLTAFQLAPRPRLETLVRTLRAGLRVFTYGSLLVLVVAPNWAVLASPVVNFGLDLVMPGGRLAGLSNHPAALGTLSVLALLLEVQGIARTRLWLVHSAAAGLTLLFAQSRTAWLAALVSLLFVYRREDALRAGRVHPAVKRLVAAGLAGSAALFSPAVVDGFHQVTSSDEVATLHGRELPWRLALEAFHENIWFGYGPGLFSDRSSPVGGAFDHAHNQVLHTLGTAGIAGAAGLLVFLLVVLWTAARTAAVTHGLSWALTATTLVLCVPEAPLRGNGFTPYLVLTLTLFTVLSTASAQRAGQQSSAPAARVPRPAAARESTAAPAMRTP